MSVLTFRTGLAMKEHVHDKEEHLECPKNLICQIVIICSLQIVTNHMLCTHDNTMYKII